MASIKQLFNHDLNEIGDFTAGAAAPPAFYWLIVGYFLQRKELSQNTKQLAFQVEELAKAAEMQSKQVQALNRQLCMNELAQQIDGAPTLLINCMKAAKKVGRLATQKAGEPDYSFFSHSLVDIEDVTKLKTNCTNLRIGASRWLERNYRNLAEAINDRNSSALSELEAHRSILSRFDETCRALATEAHTDMYGLKSNELGLSDILHALELIHIANRERSVAAT